MLFFPWTKRARLKEEKQLMESSPRAPGENTSKEHEITRKARALICETKMNDGPRACSYLLRRRTTTLLDLNDHSGFHGLLHRKEDVVRGMAVQGCTQFLLVEMMSSEPDAAAEYE